MNTKNKILEKVLQNQPPFAPLPEIPSFDRDAEDPVQKFAGVLSSIGGKVFMVDDYASVSAAVKVHFDLGKRIATTIPELTDIAGLISTEADPHSFDDIELMLMRARLGVAENGAVWITEQFMGQRILPFICQHLGVIIDAGDLVSTMHHAYAIVGTERYCFGSFISGPSKTADIEQALVLGAHGPRTMTVFIVKATGDGLSHIDRKYLKSN